MERGAVCSEGKHAESSTSEGGAEGRSQELGSE